MRINSKKKHPMDNFVTPKYLYKLAASRWGVKCTIDVCATKDNKKCRRFISKKQNFLTMPFSYFKNTDVLWCNPPHSQSKYFVERIYQIWKKVGCAANLILPINTLCSEYAEKYILPYVKFSRKIIIKGRHKFLSPRALKITAEPSVNGYVTVFYPRRKI